MTGLPELGAMVMVWPMPGRKAHATDRPVDAAGGGRFVSSQGEMVKWSAWHLEQLRAGDILLHDPLPKKASQPKKDKE